MARFEHRLVTSADGTAIAYRQYGTGPGVVVVHGSMQAAHNLTKLSVALVDGGFAVHLVQRRGRGRSGSFGPSYDADKARQDLAVVIADGVHGACSR
jgi:pimeloyl-ACP methyl ester carboxylesterase